MKPATTYLTLALCGASACLTAASLPVTPESMIMCETYETAPTPVTTTPHLVKPEDIAVDGIGDVFVVDSKRADLIRIDAVTSKSVVLLGKPTLEIPVGLSISPIHGDLYVGDENTSTIWHLPCTTRGNASCAKYNTHAQNLTLDDTIHPMGIHIDGDDHMYIADFNGHRVLRRDASSGQITQLLSAKNLIPQPTNPFGPHDIAIDPNDFELLVTDISNDDIWALKCKQHSPTGKSCKVYNTQPYKLDLKGTLTNILQPSGIVTNMRSMIYVTGMKNGVVAEIEGNVSVDLLQATTVGTLKDPVSLAIDLNPQSKALYISDDPITSTDTAQGLWKLACKSFVCVPLSSKIVPNVIPNECTNVPVGSTCKLTCAHGFKSDFSEITCTEYGWQGGIACSAIPGPGNSTTTVPDASVGVGIGITLAVVAVIGLAIFVYLRFKQGKFVVKTTTYGSAGI